MKFSLIAAVVLLALAQGSFAQDATDMQKLAQYFEDLKTKMTAQVQDLIQNQQLTSDAQTFVQARAAEIQPLAADINEKVRAATSQLEESLGPLAANVQAQLQPMMETLQRQMEALLQKLTEQNPAIGQ